MSAHASYSHDDVMSQYLEGGRFRKSRLSRWNQFGRVLWEIVYVLFFRTSPRACHGWRRGLLRLFGATVGRGVRVYPSARIYAPWKIEIDDFSSIGPDVDCYSVGNIRIGKYVTVSQYTVLCTASHDHSYLNLPLIVGEIVLEAHVWICADVFIMPNVHIGEGTVVGTRSTVLHDLDAWKVAVGSPCKVTGPRVLRQQESE